MKNLRDKALEEKNLEVITLNHRMKLEIESFRASEESKKAEMDRIVQESLQKVKSIEANNEALRNDNDRLLNRIREFERDNINLKTDLATKDAIKSADSENIRIKYEAILRSKDEIIKDIKQENEDLKYNDRSQTKRLNEIELKLVEADKIYELKIENLK